MEFVNIITGLAYLASAIILITKTKNTKLPASKNIFWALTAFSIMKAIAVLSGSASELIPTESRQIISIPHREFFSTLSLTSSGISNIFLLHFGISSLSYKTSLRLSYEYFPIILFLLYIVLYISGAINPQDVERLNHYSFGFNGALLGSIGCFNLYLIKKTSGEKKMLSGFLVCCLGLFVYSLSDGIMVDPISKIPLIRGIRIELIEMLRLFPAACILISSLFIVRLLKKEQKSKIGFI